MAGAVLPITKTVSKLKEALTSHTHDQPYWRLVGSKGTYYIGIQFGVCRDYIL